MMTPALILFAIAALGGITLATLQISKGRAPVTLAVLHGLLAAAGLVLLIIEIVQTQLGGLPLIAAILFAAAALGGLFLFATHLRSRPLPKPIIFIHGGVAVTAFVILLVSVLR